MKRKLFVIVLLAAFSKSYSQQLHTSSLYDMQGVLHNPSMVGVQQKAMIGASYRTQWSSISGAPKTATVFGSFALPKHSIGLGGYLYNDRTGPTSRTGLELAFAKHIVMQNEAKLSFGLDVRMQQMALDKAKLSSALASDPAIAGSSNSFNFDAGFGMSYTSKKFQIGASVSQLIQSKLNFYQGDLSRSEEGRLYRHFYLHSRYNLQIDDVNTLVPHFLMTYLPNAPLEFQGGVRLEHNDLLWLGVGVRARQSFVLSAGVHIQKKMTIGYAFDAYETPVSVFESGASAHEILLRYNF